MLYIGTSTGLYELNTQTRQLVPVKGNDNEVSLTKMHISCLYRDQRGLLWIGTRHGIGIYDEKVERLLVFLQMMVYLILIYVAL